MQAIRVTSVPQPGSSSLPEPFPYGSILCVPSQILSLRKSSLAHVQGSSAGSTRTKTASSAPMVSCNCNDSSTAAGARGDRTIRTGVSFRPSVCCRSSRLPCSRARRRAARSARTRHRRRVPPRPVARADTSECTRAHSLPPPMPCAGGSNRDTAAATTPDRGLDRDEESRHAPRYSQFSNSLQSACSGVTSPHSRPFPRTRFGFRAQLLG